MEKFLGSLRFLIPFVITLSMAYAGYLREDQKSRVNRGLELLKEATAPEFLANAELLKLDIELAQNDPEAFKARFNDLKFAQGFWTRYQGQLYQYRQVAAIYKNDLADHCLLREAYTYPFRDLIASSFLFMAVLDNMRINAEEFDSIFEVLENMDSPQTEKLCKTQ